HPVLTGRLTRSGHRRPDGPTLTGTLVSVGPSGRRSFKTTGRLPAGAAEPASRSGRLSGGPFARFPTRRFLAVEPQGEAPRATAGLQELVQLHLDRPVAGLLQVRGQLRAAAVVDHR